MGLGRALLDCEEPRREAVEEMIEMALGLLRLGETGFSRRDSRSLSVGMGWGGAIESCEGCLRCCGYSCGKYGGAA